jgi:hypothetical protein
VFGSVTSNVTAFAPTKGNVWAGLISADEFPPPKSHEAVVPLVDELVNVVAVPKQTSFAVNSARGSEFTTADFEVTSLTHPNDDVTVKATVNVPALVNVYDGAGEVETSAVVVGSPKFHW